MQFLISVKHRKIIFLYIKTNFIGTRRLKLVKKIQWSLIFLSLYVVLDYGFKECAKFRGSRAIMGLACLVPPWVRKFFSWVFCGSKIFAHGYFVGLKFFSWVFRGSNIFPRGCFVVPKFSLLGISWVQNFMTFNKSQ